MMEDVKFVINELNKEPFNKKLINIISYENLKGDQRISILFEIFKLIDNSVNLDIVNTLEPDDLVAQILETLRILKYRPPINTTIDSFREAIIIGDETTYTNIYAHLFRNLPELQQRAYLAKYLVKLEVSQELETDNDISETYSKYEELIEQFKLTHSNYELLRKNSSLSIQEVQKDVKNMELEKEQINNKLDNIKRRENSNANPKLLAIIKLLHEEKEKTGKMLKQKAGIDNEIQILKEKYQKLENEFNNYNNLSKFTGENEDIDLFFEKMTDEVNSKKHLIDKILPKEIDSLRKYIDTLEKLDLNSQTGNSYLENLNKKIRLLSAEINKEIEKRMLNEDSVDDKLVTFKQNAAIIGKKKSDLEKEFAKLEDQVNELRKELNEKMYDKDGNKKLIGEELKIFINQVKQKQIDYKDKKQELNELINEVGLLTRTYEILEKKKTNLYNELIKLEEDKGIVGYFSNQENLKIIENFEKDNELNREQLTNCIADLNSKINENKNQLQPLIKELKELRSEHQNLQRNFNDVKSKYDYHASSFDSKFVNLKKEVKNLDQQSINLESNLYKLDCEIELLNLKKKWVEESHSELGENKIIERIEDEINLANKNLEILMEKHRQLKENDSQSRNQIKQWSDLIKLMEVKKECWNYKINEETKSKDNQTKDYLALN